jgi:hypothetical protein
VLLRIAEGGSNSGAGRNPRNSGDNFLAKPLGCDSARAWTLTAGNTSTAGSPPEFVPVAELSGCGCRAAEEYTGGCPLRVSLADASTGMNRGGNPAAALPIGSDRTVLL